MERKKETPKAPEIVVKHKQYGSVFTTLQNNNKFELALEYVGAPVYVSGSAKNQGTVASILRLNGSAFDSGYVDIILQAGEAIKISGILLDSIQAPAVVSQSATINITFMGVSCNYSDEIPTLQYVNGNIGSLPAGSNVIGGVNVVGQTSSSGAVQNGSVTVGTAASQLNSDATLVDAITLLALAANTAAINIGNSTSQVYALAAGASITLRKVAPANIYAITATAGQTLLYIYGGA